MNKSLLKGLFPAILIGTLLLSSADYSIASALGQEVKVRLIGQPRYAVAGKSFSASIFISAYSEVTISNIHLAGKGWEVISIDARNNLQLAKNEGTIAKFEAIPEDPTQPLILTFDINGRNFTKAFDLSERNYNRLVNPQAVEAVPGSELLPFPGVDNTRADPGLGPDVEVDEDSILLQILEELRSMRAAIEDLRKKVTKTNAILSNYTELAGGMGTAVVSIEDAPILGNQEAPVTVIAFMNYQCSECRQFYKETYQMFKQKYIAPGTVRYVFHDFVPKEEAAALDTAIMANCADRQGKYWEMHDLLLGLKNPITMHDNKYFSERLGLDMKLFSDCRTDPSIREEVIRHGREAQALGLKRVPAFLIGRTEKGKKVTGQLLQGNITSQTFEEYITNLLKK